MKKVLFAVMALSSLLCSCEKDTESDTGMLVGDYDLVGVHWSGLYKDFDGDHIGHHDLLYEYVSLVGYYEPFNVADIAVAKTIDPDYGKPALAVNLLLPFPEYSRNGERYEVCGLKYVPMTVRLENFESAAPDAVVHIKRYEPSAAGLSDIYNISVYDFKDGTFSVNVHCTMLHTDIADGSQTLDTAYVTYTYRKRN